MEESFFESGLFYAIASFVFVAILLAPAIIYGVKGIKRRNKLVDEYIKARSDYYKRH